MTRITLSLSEKEKVGLCALAKKEYRDPRQQAAVIIRRELERCGFLAAPTEREPLEKVQK
jgi:hypothetical protein